MWSRRTAGIGLGSVLSSSNVSSAKRRKDDSNTMVLFLEDSKEDRSTASRPCSSSGVNTNNNRHRKPLFSFGQAREFHSSVKSLATTNPFQGIKLKTMGMKPTVDFLPALKRTSEAVASVKCPCCREPFHIEDVENHLLSVHPEVSKNHVKNIVKKRKELLFVVKEEERKQGSLPHRVVSRAPTTTSSGLNPQPSASENPATRTSAGKMKKHVCSYCNEPFEDPASFDRYDDLAKHIDEKHPEIDLDDEEAPPLTVTGQRFTVEEERAGTKKKRLPHIPAPVQSRKVVSGVRVPSAPPSTAAPGASTPTSSFKHTSSRDSSEDLPFGLPPPPTGAGNTNGVQPAAASREPPEFADDQFPCELCHKVFGSEMELLQHLELRHPDGESTLDDTDIAEINGEMRTQALEREGMDTTGSGAAPAARKVKLESVAPAQTPPSLAAAVSSYTPSTTGNVISVKCDLCSNSKIFTSEVALFSHIKYKHPEVSAQTKVKELMSSGTTSVLAIKCEFCNKKFSSHSALHGHMMAKHASALAGTPTPAAKVPLNQNDMKQKDEAAKKNPWWCNTCDKGFGSNKAILSHLNTKHGLVVQPVPCPVCRRIFPDIYSCKDHVVLTHRNVDASTIKGDETYACKHCVRKFIVPEDLKDHMKRYHRTEWKAAQEKAAAIAQGATEEVEGEMITQQGSGGGSKPIPSRFTATASASSTATITTIDIEVENPIQAPDAEGKNGDEKSNKDENEIHPDEVLFA